MLNKNRAVYNALITGLPLSDLTALYERSKEYPLLCKAIEEEIDRRISPMSTAPPVMPALQLAAAA